VTSFRQPKRAAFKVDEEATMIYISESEEIEDEVTKSQSVRGDEEDDHTFSDIVKVGVKRPAVGATREV
jgi:hypothetical protein